jgi:hypothetical protein
MDKQEIRTARLQRTNSAIHRVRSLPALNQRRGGRRSAAEDRGSVFSRDIWLGDRSGKSSVFASEVSISGWLTVGDTKRGGYIGASC